MAKTQGKSAEQERAQEAMAKREKAEEEIRELEEMDEPPRDLDDWPTNDAKYITFGGPDGESGWDDGATNKLAPSEVRHHDDGSVSVHGEKVDNPDDYKGDPIPIDQKLTESSKPPEEQDDEPAAGDSKSESSKSGD
jgi:hypothetical protein